MFVWIHLYILFHLIKCFNLNECHVAYSERKIYVKNSIIEFSLDCTYYYFYLVLLFDYIIKKLCARYEFKGSFRQYHGGYIACFLLTFVVNILRIFITIVLVHQGVDYLTAHHIMIFISFIVIVKYYSDRTLLLSIVMNWILRHIIRGCES